MGQRCTLCPHACFLEEGKLGICGVRTLAEGAVRSLNYGKATSLALDPIEKKPLALFHPGSHILSYGSFGCNLQCSFCQNSDIAQARADSTIRTYDVTPKTLVEKALSLKNQGNIGIAYTYNEPFVGWEFLKDTAHLAREQGLLNVAVTNGYVMPEIWQEALSFLDALNIDLKCFSEEGYRRVGAPHGLATVKDSIRTAYAAGIHVEVTTLVVPGLSDSIEEFTEECAWLASISSDITLHISRFFPCYHMLDKRPTEKTLLNTFKDIAQDHLSHVFLGNI